MKSSHRPDGIFTCFALLLAGRRCLCREWHGELLIVHHHGQHSWLCACSRSKVPIAPMGFSHVCARLCLQGGGVEVSGGTVSFSSCTITGNTAYGVRAHAKNFPSPDGKIADVLALTHACTTANSSVNYSLYVPRRPSKFPIAPMGKWLTLLPRLSLARTLRSTTVGTCHRDLQKFPSPRWENCSRACYDSRLQISK